MDDSIVLMSAIWKKVAKEKNPNPKGLRSTKKKGVWSAREGEQCHGHSTVGPHDQKGSGYKNCLSKIWGRREHRTEAGGGEVNDVGGEGKFP